MFWNKLRFKAALWFLALFALLACALFYFSSRYLYLDTVREIDWILDLNLREFRTAYALGQNAGRYGERIDLAEVPSDTYQALYQMWPEARVLFARSIQAGEESFQTVFAEHGGDLYEFRLTPGSPPHSRKLNPESNLIYLRKLFHDKTQSFGTDNVYFRLYNPQGELLFESNELRGGLATGREAGYHREEEAGKMFRVLRMTLFDGSVLEAGRSLQEVIQRQQDYSGQFFTYLCIVLALAAASGYLVAWRLTAGIERVAAAAARIASGDLSQRVAPRPASVEVDNLVTAFNTMSDHNEKLVQELRTVTDDIAHDLRTPLTRIRGAAEISATGSGDRREHREVCGQIAEECDRMMLMINEMLEITRTESTIDRLNRSEISLNALLTDAHTLFREVAEDKGVRLELRLPRQQLNVNGDELKLQRILANLIDNALKFTPPQGTVRMELDMVRGKKAVSVSDTGCGISPEELPHICKRFYRCDHSRSKPGNGLGLAMVQAVAQAHRAELSISSEPGKGSTFTLLFP